MFFHLVVFAWMFVLVYYIYIIFWNKWMPQEWIFFRLTTKLVTRLAARPPFLRPGAGDEERRAWSWKGNGVATDLDFLRVSTSLYFALQWDCFLSFVENVEPAVPFGHWPFTRNGLTCFYHLCFLSLCLPCLPATGWFRLWVASIECFDFA